MSKPAEFALVYFHSIDEWRSCTVSDRPVVEVSGSSAGSCLDAWFQQWQAKPSDYKTAKAAAGFFRYRLVKRRKRS